MEDCQDWANLCRCCLSPQSQVSLLDSENEIKEKFLETTSIEVKDDDGLPKKLCADCVAIMDSAYQFKKQCMRIDSELKLQLDAIISASENENFVNEQFNTVTEQFKQEDLCEGLILQGPKVTTENKDEVDPIVKVEPNESDDDYYYVLVIDDNKEPKDKSDIKTEPIELNPTTGEFENFEQSIDSFLLTNAGPPTSNLLTSEEDSNFGQPMEMEEHQESHVRIEMPGEDDSCSQGHIDDENLNDISSYNTVKEQEIMLDNANIIKILTTNGTTEGIPLKGSEKGNQIVTYLTDNHFLSGESDSLSQEEVIVCEGDDSQFQLVNCDGSELVIEYTDEGPIATVIQQEDGTFLCECGDEFKDLSEYEKHQWKHNQAEEHLCSLCGKGFESEEILTGHMLLHSVLGLHVTCPFCKQQIKRNTLTQHIKYSHNNIKPRCNVCFKTFANPNNLKRHMMIHSGIRAFECDICYKTFHQKITMQTHRLTHGLDPFTCQLCEAVFESKEAMQEHKELGQCDNMKATEKVKEALTKQMSQEITTADGETLGYACQICNKMFSIESALQYHIDNVHMHDPMELLCSECGEVLPSRKAMYAHTYTHRVSKMKTGKRFMCEICNKSCSSQAMLIMHERVHTNERPFPCHLCALRFKTKTHLRTHQLTHTREKKFGCSVCMKFFALKGNLVVHLRTHTGERPYVCSICGDAFIDSKYLKKHKLRKHAIGNVPWNQY